ncbi:MAG: sigma 54-interacting transcriptional regulator [Smithella sp.]|nr:sigma 54-interacting transcriptional regulator [Smithella sp.]
MLNTVKRKKWLSPKKDIHYDESSNISISKEEYEAIINSVHDEIMVIDHTGKIIFVNKACERFYNMESYELIGHNVKQLEKKGIFFPSVSNIVLRIKTPKTIIQTTRTGREILVTAIPIMNDANELAKVVCNSRDISELFVLRKELRKKDKLIELFSKEVHKLTTSNTDEAFFYACKKMENIHNIIKKIALSDISIILLGESGVGKTMIANVIHNISARRKGPFQVINCSAIPETLLESELFGYVKGAFTGAMNQGKNGLFESACGGTIFLDEIGDLSKQLQLKLLQVIQDKKFRKVGSVLEISTDVRIITATNQELVKKVKDKQFREDLYFRLNGISINIPPLRERKEDIAYLSHHFLEQCNIKYQLHKRLPENVMEAFYKYPWPGNIRELKSLIERLCLLSEEDQLALQDMPLEVMPYIKDEAKAIPSSDPEYLSARKSFEKLERELIESAYFKYKSSYKVAEALGISQPTAHRKIKKYLSNS